MYIVSISHKTAPVEIRERFSLSREEQEQFLKQIIQVPNITECVIVCTCNRSEVYFTGDHQALRIIELALAKFKNVALETLMKYYHVYCGENALRHLFNVTCGMDSMLLGEDEILGQIKAAYERALGLGTTKYLLNTVFQAAITCAKRIKTATKLSKTPVSIGTLVANEVMKFPKDHKKVLIIGLTGKMGNIIMKNLSGKHNVEVMGTTRTLHGDIPISIVDEKIEVVDYLQRYQYVNEADVIISATTSPHYTITYQELLENISIEKERLFIDLSVPTDIDKDIINVPKVRLYDIDYFQKVSHNNNAAKLRELEEAKFIMEERMIEVQKELYFHDFLPYMEQVKLAFQEKNFENVIYEIRDHADSEELNTFFRLLKSIL